MGVVTSHEIYLETVIARRARRRSGGQAPAVPRETLTTGLFQVPTGVGNPVTLSVYLSNFSDQPQSARVEIRGMVRGQLVPVLMQSVDVPAGEGRKIQREDLAGSTVEVVVARTSQELLPSASVTEFFPADAGVIVHLIKTPGDFVVWPGGSSSASASAG